MLNAGSKKLKQTNKQTNKYKNKNKNLQSDQEWEDDTLKLV